jgi:prevent-host-death family protein
MGVPMKTVMVTEANQRFSKLIQEVERDGVTIRILRRDRPIAVLMPEGKDVKSNKERAAAIVDMKRLLKKGLKLGTESFSRDELHDRS